MYVGLRPLVLCCLSVLVLFVCRLLASGPCAFVFSNIYWVTDQRIVQRTELRVTVAPVGSMTLMRRGPDASAVHRA